MSKFKIGDRVKGWNGAAGIPYTGEIKEMSAQNNFTYVQTPGWTEWIPIQDLEGVDNMDIQVIRKPADKKAKLIEYLKTQLVAKHEEIANKAEEIFNSNDEGEIAEVKIKGDAYKIKIIPINVRGRACILIYDYDNDGDLEASIHIDYTKDELGKYIDVLQMIREQM